MKFFSAIYEEVYTSHHADDQFNPRIAYPWIVCCKALNRLKADAISFEANSKDPFADSILFK